MRIAISLFFMLAMFSMTSAAAEEDHKLPRKSWEKIDTGTLSPEVFLNARDGYAVYTTRELVESTAMHRAQSFTVTLYRLKIGEKKPEKLGQTVTTGDIDALLGPNGIVAASDHRRVTIHIPGKAPLKLQEDLELTLHSFTADGLVCTAYRYDRTAEYAVMHFSFDREKGTLYEVRFLRPWFSSSAENRFVPNFSNGPVLQRGDYVAYTGTVPVQPARAKKGTGKEVTEVYDVRNDKPVWREDGVLEAADDKYAYFFPKPNIIVRRALDGKEKAEQMTLPDHPIRLDVHPAQVLALVIRDEKWGVSFLDLVTGERIDYDIAPNSYPRTFNHRREPFHSFGLYINNTTVPLNFDAKSGELRARGLGPLYKIPVSKRVPAKEKPKWEPLPESK